MRTPPQIAKLLQVGREKVLNWIRSGELVAFNVSGSSRPRYRVSDESLAAFQERRTVATKPTAKSRPRPKQVEGDIVFFN